MKRLITICAAAIMLLTVNVDVKAANVPVTFDFDTLTNGADATAISTYMTNIYTLAGYGSITVTDATARKDTSFPYDWPGNTTTFIWTAGCFEKDFEILFVTTPITALLGLGGTGTTKGLVYDQTSDPDFQIFAYDDTYGNVESPNGSALVTSWSIGGLSDKTQVAIPDLLFSRPVSLLVISNSGSKDVGFDDLRVIPEPATICLLGFGALSLIRRKRSV